MVDIERPTTWDDYIGQPILKTRLRVHIDAALANNKPLDHVLLTGPPGTGKTSMANLIAIECLEQIVTTVMPVNNTFMKRIVMQHQGILFLDEIHRAPKKQQEELLSLLEDHYLQLPNGQKIYNYWLTIIGATTNPEDIIPPLYDRFIIKPMFEPYTEEDMALMVQKMCEKEGITLEPETIQVVGSAAAGVPRNARTLVKAAKALTHSLGGIPTKEQILEHCGLTVDGLNEYHLAYLNHLDQLGGKAGLATLSSLLRLHPKTVQDLERILLERQCITYSSAGRELLTAGFQIIKQGVSK